ncbi:MAG TPA: BON domain-containing protein [Thermoanaerobaculia bacterium]|jgi:osmotically-inducible protein OsmY
MLGLKKSDLQIQQDVLRELRWDTRLGATEVGVETDKGIVTLTGTVDSFAKKGAASEAAHRVQGVLDVANDINVHFPGVGTPTDAEVAAAVRHALEWDVFVPHRQIRSTVADGWVTLEGEVHHIRQRLDAEAAIRNITGVKGLWNEIRVKAPKVDPVQIRKTIHDALERRVDREADRIKVDVDDGTVRLTGRVPSWMQKQAVLGAVAHAPGVSAVTDELRIDFSA